MTDFERELLMEQFKTVVDQTAILKITYEQAVAKARDLLPVKILQQHVGPYGVKEVYATLAMHIYQQANEEK